MNDLTFRFVPADFGFTEFPPTLRDVWEKKMLVPENGVLTLSIEKQGCVFIAF